MMADPPDHRKGQPHSMGAITAIMNRCIPMNCAELQSTGILGNIMG